MSITTPATPGERRNTDLQQMLKFVLGEESYGVDIRHVQEIRGWSPPTPIPETPPYILGVLDLRGAIVPIIDLHLRIGMNPANNSAITVIIVLSVTTTHGPCLFGVVADRVSDVVNIDAASLRAVPPGKHGSAEYLLGLASHGEDMVLVLDIDRMLGQESSVSEASMRQVKRH